MTNIAVATAPLPSGSTPPAPPGAVYDGSIWRVVEQVSGEAQRTCQGKRRKDPRFPFSQIVQLTPVRVSHQVRQLLGSPQLRASRGGDGPARPARNIASLLEPIERPLPAIGRSLGPRGIDLYHSPPIPSRYVLVRFEEVSEACPLLLDVRWSRFLRHGWYLSGGRFLCTADK